MSLQIIGGNGREWKIAGLLFMAGSLLSLDGRNVQAPPPPRRS